MAAINAIASARLSSIAGRDQVVQAASAARRMEQNQVEQILQQIDKMSLESARRFLAAAERKLNTPALLGGKQADWQDREIMRALEMRIGELTHGRLCLRTLN